MLHPAERIGAVAAFQPLHLPLTELQQTGGFAYAQPPACCILYHFHPLELFLTHRHHPWRVTESRCSYGVTLSWSIYTGLVPHCAPPPHWYTVKSSPSWTIFENHAQPKRICGNKCFCRWQCADYQGRSHFGAQ